MGQQSALMDLPSILPGVMSKSAFAKHMGHTPASVTQWTMNGMPVQPNGKISVQDAEHWIRDNVRPKEKASDKSELNAVRAELERAKLRKVSAEADQLEGKLVSRAEAAKAIAARARMERDRHMAWVQRITPTLANALGVSAGDLYKLLDKEMRLHLQILSETDIEDVLAGSSDE